jgi:hypothetical protein
MGAVVSGFIFGLFFISVFAGLLPVVAVGVWYKWLIISGFLVCCWWLQLPVCCRLPVFLSEPLIKLIDLMLMIWVVCVLWFQGFIFGLSFISGFAGLLPVVVGGVWYKWLIISGFLGLLLVVAIAGLLFVSWFLGFAYYCRFVAGGCRICRFVAGGALWWCG